MKQQKCIIVGMILLAAALVLTSCDDFYGSSWGKPRNNKPANIDINPGNADDWVTAAIGNPDLARAIIEKIKNSNEPKLTSTGVKLAVESGEVGKLIINNLNTISDITDKGEEEQKDAVQGLLDKIKGHFTEGGPGAKAADDIAALTIGSASITRNGGTPKLSDEYARTASPAEVGEAVMILALAVLSGDELNAVALEQKLGGGSSFGENGTITLGSGVDDERVIALAAYLNLIADAPEGSSFDKNPVTKALKDLFTNTTP
jgi:hypothetical protein